MAPIKVHGSPLSTATQRVIVSLHEKDLEFEFVPVNMATGDHKKEPFISLNVSAGTKILNFLLLISSSIDFTRFLSNIKILSG